jgi:hypothetical protein
MVSHQEPGRDRSLAERDQPFDDGPGVRPSIDQVAEENDHDLGRVARRHIPLDHREQALEQVQPPVNVADRIDTLAIGDAVGLRRPAGHQIAQ